MASATFLANLHLSLEVSYWHPLLALSVFGSLAFYILFQVVYTNQTSVDVYGVFIHALSETRFWLGKILQLRSRHYLLVLGSKLVVPVF